MQDLQEDLEKQQRQVNSLSHMVVVVDESSPENGKLLEVKQQQQKNTIFSPQTHKQTNK